MGRELPGLRLINLYPTSYEVLSLVGSIQVGPNLTLIPNHVPSELLMICFLMEFRSRNLKDGLVMGIKTMWACLGHLLLNPFASFKLGP